jgi:hypothetical protein
MHVQPQGVNKLMFPPFIKEKRGEPAMTLRLAALVKRVAEFREAGFKASHFAEEFTIQRIRPSAVRRSWLSNPVVSRSKPQSHRWQDLHS